MVDSYTRNLQVRLNIMTRKWKPRLPSESTVHFWFMIHVDKLREERGTGEEKGSAADVT